MIKLSICIATYNRADMICETMDSIIAQISDEVEIVVVDGASTDATPEIMHGYEKRCPAIRYHRMPVKGGVDRDYCHAVSFATGEYCWLLTDDDIVKPGTMNTILSLIEQKYSLIILNSEVWDKTLDRMLVPRRMGISKDTYYAPEDREKLFVEAIGYLSFIGAVVINRELWNKREKAPYIGSDFIHLGVIFQEQLPYGAFAKADPCIQIRFGNAQWSPRHFDIWLFQWPTIVWSFAGISDKAKQRISWRYPWKNYATLLLERADGTYTFSHYRSKLKSLYTSRWRSYVAGLIALSPGVLMNMAAVFLYNVMTSRDRLFLYRLRTSRFYYGRYFRRTLLSLRKVLPARRQHVNRG